MATPVAQPVNTNVGISQSLQNLGVANVKTPDISTATQSAASTVANQPQTPVNATIVGGTAPVTPSLPQNAPTQSSADIVGTNAPVNPNPAPVTPTKTTPAVPSTTPAVPPTTPVAPVAPAVPPMDRTSTLGKLSTAISDYSKKGDVTTALQNTYDLSGKQSDAVSSYNAYQQAKLASDQQIASIYNQPGISRASADAQAKEVGRINNANLANLAVIAQSAAGNLTAAQSIIQSKLDAQFAPIKETIDQLTSYISSNNANLSDSDKAILNANLTVQTNAASQLLGAKSTAYTTAIQYGINDPKVLQSIDSATTLGGVYGALNGAINPSGSTITVNPNVNGYDLTSYAPNDPNYTQNVNATSTSIGSVTSPSAADSVIKQLAPKSTVTGDMIMNASSSSGVDPNTLMSVMHIESNFGTTGAAVSNNNPGNVKFVGQAGATKGSAAQDGGNFAKFKDLQDGVNAMAQTIANKKMDPSSIINTAPKSTTTSGVPTQKGEDYAQLKASAPPIVSGALYQLQSSGSAFIDLSKVPANSQAIASAYARQHGIPLLDANQAENARVTDEAIRNIVNTIAPAWAEIAPNSSFGRAWNHLVMPVSAVADTDFYSNNKTFASNRESLAQQIKALSGSSPKLGLIGTAESALPNNKGYNELLGGSGVDTYKDGVAKLNRTLQLLNESLSSAVPGGAKIPPILTAKTNADGNAIGAIVTKNGVQYKVNVFGNYDPVK